ncbi:MAG: AMP-binding protein, partial [Candidatus Dormibacteraeota bacterium]|nr:AMP-binding protein [Candidatus Dormibacteraeota bacterium]MBO0761285.1 AMP-binding protein [Candidatus Dormibacteraeota bacterium]
MFNSAATVDRNADRWPDREAVTQGARRLTNAGLLGRVQALAASLRDLDVGRGSVVAILLNNCPEFLEATLAVNRLGATWLPLNWRLAPD